MPHQSVMYRTFKTWLPLAIAILLMAGLVDAAVQQNYRQSANDPQIQLTDDIAAAITSGAAAPDAIVQPNPTQDIASSLSTFVAIYSATGTPIGSSVVMDGKMPSMPSGVFDFAKMHGSDRFTWEPKKGLRIAAVVKPFSGPASGYVMAGRNLREIEVREHNLLLMCLIAGLVAWLLSFLAIWMMLWMETKPMHEHGGMPHEHEGPHNHIHTPPTPPSGI